MSLIVQKFGGTSVGDVEKIKRVAKIVAKAKDEYDKVIVVVSAMGHETDKLVDLAHQITNSPDHREFDMLLSSGERVSISLMAMALQSIGYSAQSFTGRQVGIITDNAHTKARILKIKGQRLLKILNEGKIAVVAGFQGVSEFEEVTTLGRGGSDTTAVALAAALKADICEIYTDVDGVYTTDPNIVSTARKLDKISYDEMLEMASLGAKVLQTRSVEFAKKYNVPIHVRSSFKDIWGTMVTKEDKDMEEVLVSGVTYNKDEDKISIMGVPDKPGVAAEIFSAIAKAGIMVDMIIQNVSEQGHTNITFTVPKSDSAKTIDTIPTVVKEIGANDLKLDSSIAKVSIVGVGMRGHSGVAAKMFQALASEGINIMMISTSEIKISCVIEAKYTELAVRMLHEAFELDKKMVTKEN